MGFGLGSRLNPCRQAASERPKPEQKKECVNGEQMTSFLLLTSKALVTSSDALVTTSPESRLSNK